jgi:response regulator RpfG family c-di-GMP phosphodiesterase
LCWTLCCWISTAQRPYCLRRTLHQPVPIIFLTQKDERSDRIAGLELGADDYITKPFDIEELRLRVQGAMRRAERESLTNPTTGLPSGRMIEEQLRSLMREGSNCYMGINRSMPAGCPWFVAEMKSMIHALLRRG